MQRIRAPYPFASDPSPMIQTLADALAERGYETLTPVQIAVSDAALADRDLLVSAQTGSGKTVGFGLAIAPTLLDGEQFEEARTPLALVIAPTRELALQVKRELAWLYAKAGVRMASCVGGMDMRDERRALERGAHIVVATPGRLVDHINRRSIDLSGIRAVVLDEADEMLDLGFREDLEFILSQAPETKRTLMFSATVPRAIEGLTKTYMNNPERVATISKESQHADITYRALVVAQQDAENAIINVLRFHDAKNALVFANTRVVVNRLTTRLSNRGFAVVALSGELSQSERANALQSMRDGRARVCVATDVAARGIDLPSLDLVVHAELPSNSETLLHRSGRTGRAGRKGISAMIVPAKFRNKAERLLKFAKLNAEWGTAPSADEVLARDEERLLADPVWDEPISESEQGMVARLAGAQSPEILAAAYLRLWRAQHTAPEDLADANTPSPRAAASFGPSKWISIPAGRNEKAEARWLLPLVCNSGGLDKTAIGAIRIQDTQTYIEIAAPAMDGFLKAIGPAQTLDGKYKVTALDSAPTFAPRGPRPERGPKPDRGPRPDRGPKPDRAPRPERSEAPNPAPKKAWAPDGDALLSGPDAPVERKPRHKSDAPRPAKVEGEAPAAKKPYGDKPKGKKSWDDKPRSDKPRGDKPWGDKAKSDKPRGDKPWADKPRSDKPRSDKPRGDKPWGDKPRSDKPRGDKPAFDKPRADANDTSKRFVPPGGKESRPAKPRGKPSGPKGGDSTLRRGKPKPR